MEKKPRTLRGNYILFRYVIEGEAPIIELKDRNGKFWYCKLVDGVFKVTSVTSKSLFDEMPPDLENP